MSRVEFERKEAAEGITDQMVEASFQYSKADVTDGLARSKIVALEAELERQHVLHDNLSRKHSGLRAKYDLARSELASLKALEKLRKDIGQ
jgi:hypothetical protein